jgi:integrase
VLEVAALAEAMPANLQLAVLLACWTSLRRAEILGLRRRDIDVRSGNTHDPPDQGDHRQEQHRGW